MIDRDTIIKLAREAGLAGVESPEGLAAFVFRFAALVAAAERERCIEACEASYHWINGPEGWLKYAVDAIRARSQQ